MHGGKVGKARLFTGPCPNRLKAQEPSSKAAASSSKILAIGWRLSWCRRLRCSASALDAHRLILGVFTSMGTCCMQSRTLLLGRESALRGHFWSGRGPDSPMSCVQNTQGHMARVTGLSFNAWSPQEQRCVRRGWLKLRTKRAHLPCSPQLVTGPTRSYRIARSTHQQSISAAGLGASQDFEGLHPGSGALTIAREAPRPGEASHSNSRFLEERIVTTS